MYRLSWHLGRPPSRYGNGDPEWTTWVRAKDYPAQLGAQQVWAKPQPGGAWAIFLLNSAANKTMQTTIPLSALNMSMYAAASSSSSSNNATSNINGGGDGIVPTATVRDIWARKMLPPSAKIISNGKFTPAAVPPYDSAFYLLTPKQ